MEINECYSSQIVSSHGLMLLESCEPSGMDVVIFNYVCGWFEGGSAQS